MNSIRALTSLKQAKYELKKILKKGSAKGDVLD